VEEALRRYNISYTMVGGFSFYERAEIKDMLATCGWCAIPRLDGAATGDPTHRPAVLARRRWRR